MKEISKAFETLFEIKSAKITKLLKNYRLNDLLVTPGIIPGITPEQHRKIEILNEYARAISAEGASYKRGYPGETARYLYSLIGGQKQENLVALLYNQEDEMIKAVRLSVGGPASTYLHRQVVARAVVEYGAKNVILAHNHPSGNPRLSQDDHTAWNETNRSLKAIGARVCDCIVIGDNTFCSMDYPDPEPIPKVDRKSVSSGSESIQQKEDKNRRANLEIQIGAKEQQYKSPIIQAALKVAEAANSEPPRKEIKISTPDEAVKEINRIFPGSDPVSGVLYVNTKHQVIGEEAVKFPQTNLQCQRITARALMHNAAGAILFRKDGDLSHNPRDLSSCQKLDNCFVAAGIDLLDALIVRPNGLNGEYISIKHSPALFSENNRGRTR